MKKFIALLFFASGILSAAQQQVIKSELTGVKVFLRGAELTHTSTIKLQKGVSEIAFSNVASTLDQNSLNVSAKGDLVILSVVQNRDYLQSPDSNPLVKMLKDSLEILNSKSESKQNDINLLRAELDLLNANREIGSKEKGVSIIELQKMIEFYKKRVGDIYSQQTSKNNDLKILQKNIDRINKQLAELNTKLNQPVSEIIVTVSAKSTTNAEFTISYLTYDAGWQPAYDIRVKDINSTANLSYKASVHQNSGLDWNNVNVVLSTRNPVQNNNKPDLNPWFIDFERQVLYKQKMGGVRSQAVVPMVMESAAADNQSQNMADYIEVNQIQLAVEFVPAIKYSIPSDNKPHIISLQDYSVPAKYEYYAAPKLDNNAFLVAYLTNWNDFNLLPGQVSIYFENSYVGQSYINPQSVKDTLAISLGRDQGISLTRETLKDFSEDKFLSSDVERTFGFDIIIKNNKSIPIKILVEEQIPISKNEDIQVKLINHSGAVYSEVDGKLKWNISVDPSKSVTKKLVYSVRYPKDQVIQGLQLFY